MITKAFDRAFKKLKERDWDKIFVTIDLHETMIKPTYESDDVFEFYDGVIDTLKMMSNSEKISLILFTSSHPVYRCEFMKHMCFQEHIYFDHHNDNPEVVNTSYGCFDDGKFYYDVLIDDKAGFDPEEDWTKIQQKLKELLV
jgi:hypothetical protein